MNSWNKIWLTGSAKWFVLLTKYYSGDKIKKNEMGWAYSTCGWRGEMFTAVWWGNPRERATWKTQA